MKSGWLEELVILVLLEKKKREPGKTYSTTFLSFGISLSFAVYANACFGESKRKKKF